MVLLNSVVVQAVTNDVSRCDVHVLTQDHNQRFWDQCFTSLSTEPVNVHLVKGISGHIGRSRYGGYGLGTSEYVSFVDDDDYVIPGSYQACIDFLDANPGVVGVCTDELIQYGRTPDTWKPSPHASGVISCVNHMWRIHHIVVMRRDVVVEYADVLLDFPNQCERALYHTMISAGHTFVKLPFVGYVWRRYLNGAHTKASQTRQQLMGMFNITHKRKLDNMMIKKNERCDVHVIMVERDKQYWDQCFGSLVGEPVNVHQQDDIDGNLGKGRFKGYGLGVAEYVSYVGCDGYVLPGAYTACIDYLDDHPEIAAVSTRELVLMANAQMSASQSIISTPATWTELIPKRTLPFRHVFVARRAIVDKYRAGIVDFSVLCDRALCALMIGHGHPITQIDCVGYAWRKYNINRDNFNKDREAMALLRQHLQGV